MKTEDAMTKCAPFPAMRGRSVALGIFGFSIPRPEQTIRRLHRHVRWRHGCFVATRERDRRQAAACPKIQKKRKSSDEGTTRTGRVGGGSTSSTRTPRSVIAIADSQRNARIFFFLFICLFVCLGLV